MVRILCVRLRVCAGMLMWVMLNRPLRRRKVVEGKEDDKFCLFVCVCVCGWLERTLSFCVGGDEQNI